MRIAGGTSGAFQANWYVVGPENGSECVIIDPGQDAAGPCRRAVAAAGLAPAAVLATHGHIDHIADAAELADGYGVPLHIHAQDRPFLTDPVAALSPELGHFFGSLFPGPFQEPADVREYQIEGEYGTGALGIGGLVFELRHAPGHTPGSTLLALGGAEPLVFTGDVVFAGSIGRTDFRVGDPAAMRRSLARQVLTLPDAARLLPGHGPATTLARERRTNPFLR
ncbi:MAG: MBL fold metallo-hydrolase [Bifidobacteriaceae bacterium]|jgi:glyoxylase-like metal-dependent hydrolase (beta-lactamase superfamily II)|nr:MBL fold metallo-hydrolase [Bifidobacteriaceae bacterium]